MKQVAVALLIVSLGCRDQRPATSVAIAPVGRAVRAIVTPPAPVLFAPVTSASLWSAAASSQTTESWTAVAEALERELAECTQDCLFIAHSLVDARERAERATGNLILTEHEFGNVPPTARATIDAWDTYVSLAPPSDPDVETMRLKAAMTLDYRDQLAAIPRLEAFVSTYRDDSRSFAAGALLDSLIRNRLADELSQQVAQLLADPAALDADLQQRLASLHAQIGAGEMPPAAEP